MTSGPTIALFPEASFGAALNCVGIAQELERQGANPVFICHPGFTGVFAEYGFKEYHLPEQRRSNDASNEDYWQGFINTHLPHFNLSALDQLATYVAPTWEAIVSTAEAVEDGLRDLFNRIKPDAILLDNVIMFPAVANAGCPWVRIVSCAETELPDANVPPYLSGLAPDDVPARTEFEKAYVDNTRAPHRRYNEFRKARKLPPLPAGIFLETSPWLNLLLAPACVRYQRAEVLPEGQFVFLEGCVRDEGHFKSPHFPKDNGPLVYLSFGSLGASDTQLIGRMIEVFATLPARFLVNVGGFLEAYSQVPDNVILGSWFPQPSVVAECAVIIHHGGNNSFCEALYHGVPSLVMPYCWDGHDNAQRAEAVGVGRAIHRADWEPEDLRSLILELLNNAPMKTHLAEMSDVMKKHSGTRKAAEAVLKVALVPA
ncbi:MULTISPECIES: glycosyltransferase [Ruegeria]|uniref:glycosyltransferase n=1 Tax=Ruegeria TaxID=97050 RepID=UPI002493BFDC|nr:MULTISPECIES: glycosyltransferase [Ruegeria]